MCAVLCPVFSYILLLSTDRIRPPSSDSSKCQSLGFQTNICVLAILFQKELCTKMLSDILVSLKTLLKTKVVVGPGQVPGHLTLGTVQVPFSPNDLVLWQQKLHRLRDDPEKVVHTIRGVLRGYDPTWADVQQLLESVFTPDGHIRIQEHNPRWAAEATGRRPWPMADPGWDHNTEVGLV